MLSVPRAAPHQGRTQVHCTSLRASGSRAGAHDHLGGRVRPRGGRGRVEIDDAHVLGCVKNDVNVLQMDLEDGLSTFRDGSFAAAVVAFLGLLRSARRVGSLLQTGE